MNIVVDGFNIGLPQGTGIATYGRGFMSASCALGHRVELLLGCDDPTQEDGTAEWRANLRKVLDFLGGPLGLGVYPVDALLPGAPDLPPAEIIWNRPRLFRAAQGAFRRTGLFTAVTMPHVDIAHWTYPLPLYVPGARNIYTIHDVVPIKHPEMARNGAEYGRICQAVGRRADHVLTVSESARSDIIAHLGLDPDRVKNTYQVVPAARPDLVDAHSLLATHGLSREGYFLFYGAIEPKKNVLRLLTAYEQSGSETPLVIVGKAGWDCKAEVDRLTLLTAKGPRRVLWLDYLPRDDLLRLVANAKAVLFPSLAEGFGLPVVEAMAYGRAVLTSWDGALAEVSGGAALLVDPTSIASIRDGIIGLDGNAALRHRFEADGSRRAEFFSQAQYQTILAALLRDLL
ncbi:glycosyltransferase family 4 protein [Sphingobium limneticum]|jgi:glycosyltransferase involved in cell wall biosynthesis|uniref:glycosyltransferase family 4 protein n=1 Tax=Sphingobium TaxID=165695 RepID=UPI003137E64E